MSFMEKWKAFDKWASEPCLYIRVEKYQDDENNQLRAEVRRLRTQLEEKRIGAIESKCELLE